MNCIACTTSVLVGRAKHFKTAVSNIQYHLGSAPSQADCHSTCKNSPYETNHAEKTEQQMGDQTVTERLRLCTRHPECGAVVAGVHTLSTAASADDAAASASGGLPSQSAAVCSAATLSFGLQRGRWYRSWKRVTRARSVTS